MTQLIPTHVALIMDGNRRWAKERGFPTIKGHDQGAHAIEPLIEHAKNLGIKDLTFWAFSSENWNRGKIEVGFILQVFRAFLKSSIVTRMKQQGVKIQIIGEYKAFPQDIVAGIEKLLVDTEKNDAITVIFALNYGGRAEILHAAKGLLRDGVKEDDLTDTVFEKYLYTVGQPDPDLIIRTGGELRLSGYLPWQGVYSELYFTKTYWPDFDPQAFDLALEEYARRNRRFGK
jgi:undecaprenyl diphosphate synthase